MRRKESIKDNSITIRITSDLKRELKITCAERGISIGDYLQNIILADIKKYEKSKEKK